MWCYLFVEMLALNCTQRLDGLLDQSFSITFSKKENYIYDQKVVFLDDFETNFKKMPIHCKIMAIHLNYRLVRPTV